LWRALQVYFGQKLYQSDDGEREDAMVTYAHAVLDALGVRHGPSHLELIWLERHQRPCLVEVGCRPHGGEGTFVDVAEAAVGYSQLGVMLDVIETPPRFRRLPRRPARFAGAAVEVILVSYERGRLLSYAGLANIRALPSFQGLEIRTKPGSMIAKTIDLFTTPGSVMLVHADRAQVERDMALIFAWQKPGGGLYNVHHPDHPPHVMCFAPLSEGA
jgi:biotin carboxylase